MNPTLLEKLSWREPDEDDAELDELVEALATEDGRAADENAWPERLWSLLDRADAPRWAVPREHGGTDLEAGALMKRYARLASGSLTAMFVLSQHDAAIRRLRAAPDCDAAGRWLDAIGGGPALATVGISHLTTSRRLGRSAIGVEELGPERYRLNGTMPWVTGAPRADVVVTAAALDDGRQLLIVLPTDRPGVSVQPPFRLAALQASCTSQIDLKAVEVDGSDLLAGPEPDVLAHAGAVGTGGLETSALALGQARASLAALVALGADRSELVEPLEALCESWQALWGALIDQARGQVAIATDDDAEAPNPQPLRARANALVLRSTQAYLAARKGTGFLLEEPAQRWARQALFFLVWSCPAPISQAAIRDLAGLCPA